MPDVNVTCEQCKGRRDNRETLEIKDRGKVDRGRARSYGRSSAAATRELPCHREQRFEHCRMWVSATSNSASRRRRCQGAKAQRVTKLAKELSKRGTGRTLYILDERRLGYISRTPKAPGCSRRACRSGGTRSWSLSTIGDVIKRRPCHRSRAEGGAGGGQVVAQGISEEVALMEASATGRFLGPGSQDGSVDTIRGCVGPVQDCHSPSGLLMWWHDYNCTCISLDGV